MVFTNKNNNNEYDLLRFCNKLNTNIIDGANDMLKYFINKYNSKIILTFVDKRYSNGDLFKKLGFVKINETPPNSHCFKKGTIKREHEIANKEGYLRIYDCGTILLKLNSAV